jgi:hypothetical protein
MAEMKSALMKKDTSRKALFIFLNCLIALIGCIRISYAMRWGPWAFSDSASYFSAARNLIAGDGLVISRVGGGKDLYQLFPPMYPITLGAAGWLLGDLFTTAYWINIFAFGIFLFLAGNILYKMTRQILLSLLAPTLLIVSPMMMADFTGAMTEPLFLTFMLLSIWVTLSLIEEQNIRHMMAFILATAFLPVTRYAGIAFAMLNFVLLIFLIQKPLKTRLSTSLFASICAAIPILSWLFYLFVRTEKIGGRRFLINSFLDNLPYSLREIAAIIKTFLPYDGIYEKIISSDTRFNFAVVIFLIIITWVIYTLVQRVKDQKIPQLALKQYIVFPVYLIGFLAFISLSFSASGRGLDIDHRVLSPFIPLIILTMLLSFSHIFSFISLPFRNLFIIASIVLYGLIFRFYYFTSRTLVRSLHEEGYGYTARQYRESDILKVIQEIPEDRIIISNLSGFILLYDNRLPMQIDHFYDHMYGSGDTYGEKTFRIRQAALVLIHPDFHNAYGDSSRELYQTLTNGLDVAYYDEIGAIYYFPQ